MKLFKKREPSKLRVEEVELTPFNSGLVVNRFDCGRTGLNRFLKNKAKKAESRMEQRVTVASLSNSSECIGYYALQLGSDTVPDFPKDKLKHVQNHTAFPAVHLSYLAVDERYQRQGLGRFLLMDVFEQVARISEIAGFYALTLQSLDDDSTAFYESLGFVTYSEGSGNPKMLYPLEDMLTLVRGQS